MFVFVGVWRVLSCVRAQWMAPEELIYTTNTGSTLFKVSAQADVWSFGVFLWEVGTGRIQVPWDGLHEGQVLAALQGGHTLATAGLNPLVQDLLARCWNRDPVQRCESPDPEQPDVMCTDDRLFEGRPAMAEVHEVLRALAHRLQTDEQAAAAAAATAEALLAVMRAKAKPELTHEIPSPSAQPDGHTSTPTRTASRRSSAALPAPPAPAQGVAVKARTQRVVGRRRSGLPQPPVAAQENSIGTVIRNAVEQRRGAFAETLETNSEEDGVYWLT
jgi:serine/threonine protein kinase